LEETLTQIAGDGGSVFLTGHIPPLIDLYSGQPTHTETHAHTREYSHAYTHTRTQYTHTHTHTHTHREAPMEGTQCRP
jgi:hypothetical protein